MRGFIHDRPLGGSAETGLDSLHDISDPVAGAEHTLQMREEVGRPFLAVRNDADGLAAQVVGAGAERTNRAAISSNVGSSTRMVISS